MAYFFPPAACDLPPIPETALREVLRHHVLDFLCDEAGFDHQLAEHMRQWDPKPEQPCPRPALAD